MKRIEKLCAVAGAATLSLHLGCSSKIPTAPAPPTLPPVAPPPVAPPANIGGSYTVTLTAAATCSMLPDYARTRTYNASIAQSDGSTSGTVQLSSDKFQTQFTAFIGESTVSFGIDTSPGLVCSDSWFEELVPTGWLYVCGHGQLRIDGTTMAGTLSGTIGYEAVAGDYSTAKECDSSHLVTFNRK
jgi:hypothetical protein